MMTDALTLMYNRLKEGNMERYPEQIQKSVRLLKKMQANSRNMAMWKNVALAREVVSLLETLPTRGESHSPYDKIFLLDMLTDNISNRDLPRFTISVLENMLELSAFVTEEDIAEYEYALSGNDIRLELDKWRKYIDADHVTDEEWVKEYGVHLKFDPIERTRMWEDMYERVEKEVDREIGKRMPRGMGFCHLYWSVKTSVLADWGIEWHSPSYMNPGVLFD